MDFSVCEEEQIHAPGCIQPSGVLVAVDRATGGIAAFSKNAPDLLSESLDGCLGRPWLEVAAEVGLDRAAEMSKDVPWGPRHVRFPVKIGAQAFELYLHTNGACDFWEFELVEEPGDVVPRVIEAWREALKSPGFHMFRLAQETAETVAALTGYDRVMFYKFHPDWSGEIIAEARKKTELLPFLGLRYPATDIPSQARQLYRENRLRTIANVHAISEHLVAPAGAPPLDLSHAILRGFSPYHIEYLKNMGVGATMVISIMVNGELWGLIACHHMSPKRPSPAVREACLEVAEVLGQWVGERLAKRRQVGQERTRVEQELLHQIFGGADREKLLHPLIFGQHRLELLTGSNAVAVLCGESYAVVGTAPELGWLHAVRRWLLENLAEGEIFSSDKLPDFWPVPEEGGGATCGVLAGVVSKGECPVVILCFRGETLRHVHWGGDPSRPVVIEAGNRLSPRKSFELWRETVRNRSMPWSEETLGHFRGLLEVLRETVPPKDLLASFVSLDQEISTRGVAGSHLLDSLQCGVAIFSCSQDHADWQALTTSRRFDDLFDLSAFDIRGRPIDELLGYLGLKGLQAALSLPEPQKVQIWVPEIGPRSISVDCHDFIRLGTSGTCRRLSILEFIDVTEDQRLTDALLSARDQALLAVSAKSALLANMSHELRTPLNAIIGFSDLMANESLGPIGTPAYVKFAKQSLQAGEHLLALINDILDHSKLESQGKLDSEKTIDIGKEMQAACEWVRGSAETKGVRMETDIPAAPCLFIGDARRLRQLAINLLSNAVKFTPPNGNVLCRLERLADGITIFEVRDTGIGIPAKALGMVFDQFYQADNSSTRSRGGVGLGLAVCKTIVSLHGGRIDLDSKLSEGTSVKVQFPAWRAVGELELEANP